MNRIIPLSVGGAVFSCLWPTGYRWPFKKHSHAAPPPLILPKQDCLWEDNIGSLPAGQTGVDLKGIEPWAAVHHPLAAALGLSPDGQVWGEGGAEGLKNLLTIIAVDPKICCVRVVSVFWVVGPIWVPSMASQVPPEPHPRHPVCTGKGAAWLLVGHLPALCPGAGSPRGFFDPVGALKEPAARVGERGRLSTQPAWAFPLGQELSSCRGKPVRLMDHGRFSKSLLSRTSKFKGMWFFWIRGGV